MRRLNKIIEKFVESIFTMSGMATTIIILLIIVFLFKEGFGIFSSPVVENEYVLCVNSTNSISSVSSYEIKQIFDYEIENWAQLGGADEPITVFRFEEIFNRYSDEELGTDYELLPQKLGEIIASTKGIIAFLPEQYAPRSTQGVQLLRSGKITPTSFFTGREWLPSATPSPQFGVLPMILGTLLVSFAAIIIALPLGMGAAIYMAELAGERTRKVLKPAVELLSGIPSVVYGFFGLVVLVPLVQKVFDLPVGETGLAGSIILAIMALPTIITVSEDAMRNTPRSMREASLALGATNWQTIYKIVIPYAKSGIAAAAVLGIGRAVGETMAVLMVTGNAAIMPTTLLAPVRTIPATIAAEIGEVPAGSSHYQALFMLGCILFLITLVISITAETISKRQHYKGL